MATATRAQRTNAPATAPTTDLTGDINVVLPPAKVNKICGAIAEHNAAKSAAEKAEKKLKAELRALLPQDVKLAKGQKFRVFAGKTLRATFVGRRRSGVNTELLIQAFPEAYAACSTETEYEQYAPA